MSSSGRLESNDKTGSPRAQASSNLRKHIPSKSSNLKDCQIHYRQDRLQFKNKIFLSLEDINGIETSMTTFLRDQRQSQSHGKDVRDCYDL